MSKNNKLAVVTGASSGIGQVIAADLASRGWDVAFNYGGNSEGADRTIALIEGSGRRGYGEKSDVGDSNQVRQFFANISERFDATPTLLVNNAAVQTWAPLLELKEEDWDRTISINLKGTFICTQLAARGMRDAGVGGAIVNIGSGCNKEPFPKLVDYTASKGGIEMFTRSAAIELGEFGIRVNCVAPGAIEIERTRLEAPEYAQTWAALAPMGRVGKPEDIARTVAFLADDDADYITAQTIYVDGGAFSVPNWPYQA